jgi:PHP family Zn ribbon phosphoesterase
LLHPFRAELHVHTVLSPCAEVEMIPPLIVEECELRGINLIAITDHNSSANIASVQKAAQGHQLTVLPGMELQTIEEVHSLCLFDTLEQITEFQKIVSVTLPSIKNDPDHFGEQFVVDETGDFIRREEQMLIISSSLTLHRAWQIVQDLGGLFIPAHVNRKAFGLLENLGFVPLDIPIQCVEISRHLKADQAALQFPQIAGYPLLKGGDAHRLDELAGMNEFLLAEPSIREILLAIEGKDGRTVNIRD